MRDIIKLINKRCLAETTGISYARLRKYSAGQLKNLTDEEIKEIYNYLLSLAECFKKGEIKND